MSGSPDADGAANGRVAGKKPMTVFGWLSGDEDARVCKDIPEDACDEQPRSFLIHLLTLTLTKVGDGLVDAKLVLPWLLSALGAPPFLTALLVPVRESLSLLPQLFVAAAIRRMPRRKWFWVAGSVGQAAALLLMAVAALSFMGALAGWTVVGLLALFALARGICSVSYKDVQGKTIAKTRRGTVSGYASSASGFIVVAFGAWLVFFAGGDDHRPAFFAAIIMAAAGMWLLAAVVFSRLAEFAGATRGGGNAIVEAVANLKLSFTDSVLRRFLIARTLMLGTALVTPFYVLLAREAASADVSALGLMVVAAGLASALSSMIWGRLADRSSRLVMVAGGALACGLGVATWLLVETGAGMVSSLWFYGGAIFILGIAHAGVRLGRSTYVVDASTSETRATYVAVSNTVIGVMLLAGGILGGIVQTAGPAAAVLAFSLMAGLASIASWAMKEA